MLLICRNAFTYGTIAQTTSDLQDVRNSPAISMGPYSSSSRQTELLRSISVYSERGKSREQVRLLYMNAAALGVLEGYGQAHSHHRRTKEAAANCPARVWAPFRESRYPHNALRLSDCRSCTF
jgi:hypothetical protein